MAQFYTNEAVSLEKQVETRDKKTRVPAEKFDWYYDIEKCTKWIKENDYKKVCIQFPDYLLPDSTKVCKRLQDELNQRVYILGDTSYGSCCLDYVAAAHVGADALIHFGAKCFSEPSGDIPSLFVHEKFDLDVNSFRNAFLEMQPSNDSNKTVVLDTPYSHYQDELQNVFIEGDVSVISVDDLKRQQIKENVILYVGSNDRKLLNFKLMFKDNELYYYDATSSDKTLKKYEVNEALLKRRRFLIEKVKDSETIGIIIGTVAVKNYLTVIDRMKRLFGVYGKKYYLISVGKPTVAKLANFPEMDIYVLIGCALNELHDSRDFFKPILTPYDVEVALNPQNACQNFAYDFNQFITENNDLNGTEQLLESDVSLLTGKIRSRNDVNVELASEEVALRNAGELAVTGFLGQRSWHGLEQKLGESEVRLAEEGRKGIAFGYANEVDK